MEATSQHFGGFTSLPLTNWMSAAKMLKCIMRSISKDIHAAFAAILGRLLTTSILHCNHVLNHRNDNFALQHVKRIISRLLSRLLHSLDTLQQLVDPKDEKQDASADPNLKVFAQTVSKAINKAPTSTKVLTNADPRPIHGPQVFRF